jgi:hypothetical protein
MDKPKPHDNSSDEEQGQPGKDESGGFKTMQMGGDEDFETVSNVKYDKAFNYQYPTEKKGIR